MADITFTTTAGSSTAAGGISALQTSTAFFNTAAGNSTADGGYPVYLTGTAKFDANSTSAASANIPFATLPPNASMRFRVPGGVATWRVEMEVYTTAVSPASTPNGGYLLGTNYWLADGTTPATNSAGYTGNGNAGPLTLNEWSTASWSYVSGGNVSLVDVVLTVDPYYSGDGTQLVRNVKWYLDGSATPTNINLNTATYTGGGYVGDGWFYADSKFTTNAAAATGSTTGTGMFKADTRFVSGPPVATAAGNVGTLNSDKFVWTTIAAAATASGRVTSMLAGTAPLEGVPVVALATTDVALTADPFQGFDLERVDSRYAVFAIDPWRVVNGIPRYEAQYACVGTPEASIDASTIGPAFVDPLSAVMNSQYRWLATSYTTPDWTPIGTGGQAAGPRSWEQMRDQFTWATARLRTWDQLRTITADTSVPLWQNYGASSATKSTAYTYWRVSDYIANPAVLVKPGTALQMVWTPAAVYPQITVALVLVPRAPTSGSYELLRARSDLRVVMNTDSTMDLIYGSTVLSTSAIGARARPNEPIVVALSVALNPPELNAGSAWRYYMVVVDTMVRTTTNIVSGTMAQTDLDWRIGANQDATCELLEVDVYTEAMTSEKLASEMSAFDRIYGVTLV